MPCPELPLLFHLLENDPSPSRGDMCSDKQLNTCFLCFFFSEMAPFWVPSYFLQYKPPRPKAGCGSRCLQPSTWEVGQGHHKFEASLSYTAISLRYTRYTMPKQNLKKSNTKYTNQDQCISPRPRIHNFLIIRMYSDDIDFIFELYLFIYFYIFQ